MFEEINGLPAHPLLVHAAVVFVPLLCLAAVVYALVPRFRGELGWAAAGLAVVAPGAAWFATLSGDRLGERLYQGQLSQEVIDHQGYGDLTLYNSIGLGLITLALVFLTGTRRGRAVSLPPWVPLVLAGAAVVSAAVTAYFVVQAGDSGAATHWGGL